MFSFLQTKKSNNSSSPVSVVHLLAFVEDKNETSVLVVDADDEKTANYDLADSMFPRIEVLFRKEINPKELQDALVKKTGIYVNSSEFTVLPENISSKICKDNNLPECLQFVCLNFNKETISNQDFKWIKEGSLNSQEKNIIKIGKDYTYKIIRIQEEKNCSKQEAELRLKENQ